jgi:hypothetical protein
MGIASYALSASAWTQITSVGQSGSCWLKEGIPNSQVPDVRVLPSVAAPSVANVLLGKRVYEPNQNNDVLSFDGSANSEVLWAMINAGALEQPSATIIVSAE